jgi:hypothetical protein
MKNLKNISNFLNESYMEDFKFKTKLGPSEINFTNYGEEYDDVNVISAIVQWHLNFDFMGNEGVDFDMVVDKVEIEYVAIVYEGDTDVDHEKTLIIDDSEFITTERISTHSQIVVDEITVDGDHVDVKF